MGIPCKLLALFVTLIAKSLVSVECTSITNMENLHSTLMASYNKDVRPIADQTKALNVTLYPYLRSIQDLDEVRGELSFTGALSLSWIDSKITWNPSTYGGLNFIYISYESAWVPEIVITTTTDESDTFAKKWQKVKYTENGDATFTTGGRYLASCNVVVEKFPFDKQLCNVSFTAWGYDSTEVLIIAGQPTIDTSEFEGNSVWKLTKTETETYVLQGWSYISLNFYLERKPGFTLVSLMSPLLFMNFLNVLVFVLVPDSGERISYSVTVLLAIAVFMTIISDSLPASSDPVPKITYKLMADMIISVLITMTTILNLRLYHKDDAVPVPKRLQDIYKFLQSCKCCFKNGRKVGNVQVGTTDVESTSTADLKQSMEEKSDETQEQGVTWKEISFMVDYIALVVFSLSSFLASVIYIATTVV